MKKCIFRISHTALLLGALLWLAGAAQAQPPALMQYQGRLTSSTGAPLTTAQTVYFSLWQGGTAATASSGTQFYSEQATITPDANGIFEYQIGSGTNKTGSLTPAQFNTASSIYLQIAVGSTGAVILPRTQITTVGYAMVAGATTAGASSLVTSVTDLSGGLVVVGDRIQLSGAGLASASVKVGGRPARILSSTATTLIFQIPTGVPEGINEVTLCANGNTAFGTVASVDVHRLLIALAPQSRRVYVLDSRDGTVLSNLSTGISFNLSAFPIQMGFGAEGALALIPGNNEGSILALDLTANPPALVATVDPGNSALYSIAVSPDNTVAVLSDSATLRAVTLTEQAPPFTSNLFSGSTKFNFTNLTGATNPRGATFIGDQLLLVAYNSGVVVGFRRDPSAALADQFHDTARNTEDKPTFTSVGTAPRLIKPLRDLTRVLILNGASNNLLTYLVTPRGLADANDAANGSAPAGSTPMNFGFSAADGIIVSADETNDQLYLYYMNGTSLERIYTLEGFIHDDPDDDYQAATMDPADGKKIAISTNWGQVILTKRIGASLSFTPSAEGSTNDKTFDTTIDLPSISKESIPLLEFQP